MTSLGETVTFQTARVGRAGHDRHHDRGRIVRYHVEIRHGRQVADTIRADSRHECDGSGSLMLVFNMVQPTYDSRDHELHRQPRQFSG